jgi:hypothetical protein
VEALPLSPDNDTVFEGFGGQRLAWFDTSTEAHAIDAAVYKVQILPPGSKTSPNGLPVAHLYYRNDDGGPGFGRDSVVHFTAPADGEYLVRIRDVQGLGGDNAATASRYAGAARLRLTVNPHNPNVPWAARFPAVRLPDDGFDGPIDVSCGLPAGIRACG